MKPPLARYLVAAFLFASATFLFADDFKSMVIPGDGTPHPLPRVHGDQFMVIRNFTQEMGGTRGVVTVSKPPNPPNPVSVLAAAILTASPPDVINSIVIAGAADVSVTCGPAVGNCFISYKKDSN
jgi:hypothetical protein